MQPQTLQIATWLLYLSGFFAFVSVIDKTGYLGYLRYRFGIGLLLGLVVVGLHIGGAFLMANDLKLGYRISVAAALAPFLLRAFAVQDISSKGFASVSLLDYIICKPLGGSVVTVMFDGALVALILHQQSRNHQRIWFR